MKSQKEITLAKDLQLRDRQDIYRNFLLYCMSGDTIALPMGSTVVVERDQTEFARLSQLGDVLGLQQFEVAHVHSELAEQAYRQQVSILPPPASLCQNLLSLLSLCVSRPHQMACLFAHYPSGSHGFFCPCWFACHLNNWAVILLVQCSHRALSVHATCAWTCFCGHSCDCIRTLPAALAAAVSCAHA